MLRIDVLPLERLPPQMRLIKPLPVYLIVCSQRSDYFDSIAE
jgi:hypothetical protein